MAFSISALLGLSQLTWNTYSAGGMSGEFSVAGRFSSSSNVHPSLQLISITSEYVAFLVFDRPVCLLVRSR